MPAGGCGTQKASAAFVLGLAVAILAVLLGPAFTTSPRFDFDAGARSPQCPARVTNATLFDLQGDGAGGRLGGVDASAAGVGGSGSQRQNLDFTSARDGRGLSLGNLYDRFVVTFRDYKLVGEHKARLSQRLNARLNETQRSAWEWVDRKNVALKYPTDFGLVAVKDRSVLDVLRSVDVVRDVFADAKMAGRRELLGTTEREHKLALEMVSDSLKPGDILAKGPGRLHTPFSSDRLGEPSRRGRGLISRALSFAQGFNFSSFKRSQIKSLYKPEELWKKGITGKGIKVGIFDTGVREDHPDLKNIAMRVNFTYQQSTSDGLGHGSFVAGCIASVSPGCPSNAPDVALHTFKVFTDDQTSYTSWYLDALNYAMVVKLHIINVSIGGPDWSDKPFVHKFRELVGQGVIIICAHGNAGPDYGTANNPGDEHWSIAVGGHTDDFKIAHFQSRGHTMQEKPFGYGRIKPDVVAYGHQVSSLRMERGCKEASGTSVASPVAAGIAALVASSVPESEWHYKLTPASMKQVLQEGAERLPRESIYIQGPGKANLHKSFEAMQRYEPKVTVFPGSIDLLDQDYMWPLSKTPLYATAMPLIMNLTITNGLGAHGYFEKEPEFTATNKLGEALDVHFERINVLWPWSGWIAIFVQVRDSGRNLTGVAEGVISFTIRSPPFPGEREGRSQRVEVPFKAKVIRTPDRNKRVLWDDYHNIQYPPEYVPIDDLNYRKEMLDWNGDHPHTNFHPVFDALTDNGYYVEVLGSSLTCFDASNYGTLALVDSEGEFHAEEIEKLHNDVSEGGLGLLIVGEWWNKQQMRRMKFFDDNTRDIWTPIVGGANVPALNRLLADFGIAFSDEITTGQIRLGRNVVSVNTGTSIKAFPARSSLFTLDGGLSPVLGLTRVGQGNVLAFGDTSAFDFNTHANLVPSLFLDFVKYTAGVAYPSWFKAGTVHNEAYENGNMRARLPNPSEGLDAKTLKILRRPLECHTNARRPKEMPVAERPLKPEEPVANPVVPDAEVIMNGIHKVEEKVATAVDGLLDVNHALTGPSEEDATSNVGGAMPHTGIVQAYFQRQLFGFLVVVVCLCVLIVWRKVHSGKRSKLRATKNRYTRLRQIV